MTHRSALKQSCASFLLTLQILSPNDTPQRPDDTAGQALIFIQDPLSSLLALASCTVFCSADRLLSPGLSGQGSEDAVLGQWCQDRTVVPVLGGRHAGHRGSIYELNSTRWLLLIQLSLAAGGKMGKPLEGGYVSLKQVVEVIAFKAWWCHVIAKLQ